MKFVSWDIMHTDNVMTKQYVLLCGYTGCAIIVTMYHKMYAS